MCIVPISTDTSSRRTPWVNYALIAANVVVFLVDAQMGGLDGRRTVIGRILDQGPLRASDPLLYQFLSYQFLHANFAHIAGNMLFLWVFGNPVNAKMGHGPYLFFYLAGGVFAATGYAWHHDHPMMGASGAIAAVTTAYLALFPRSYITILYWCFFIGTFELPSMVMIVFKMILWDNVLAKSMIGESNVAFDAHLAGYTFGLVATVGMLVLRVLPRAQFDIVALWRRWIQRRAMQVATADPNARARAQYGRVARPVVLDPTQILAEDTRGQDQVTAFRIRIAESLARLDRDTAAQLYAQLMEIDPRQVLARQQQLEVANQLYTLNLLPQAAAAYEKYLSHYAPSPEADQVELLLGIIYVRDLKQYEVAQGHLRHLLERFTDEKRREQCQHWLNVVNEALGRGAPEP